MLVKPEEDNMLKITNDGKKLALEPRCFDDNSFDDDMNKVNMCINNVFEFGKTQLKIKVHKLYFVIYQHQRNLLQIITLNLILMKN